MKKLLLLFLVLGLVLAMASCDMLPESITSILGIGSNDNGQNDGNDDLIDDSVGDANGNVTDNENNGEENGNDAPDDNTSNGENNDLNEDVNTDSGNSTPEHVHSYSVDTVVDSTCDEEGYTIFVCECGDTNTLKNDALGHEAQLVDAKAPTCTEDGWNEHYACMRCEYTTLTELIPALGHNHRAIFDELSIHDGGYYVEDYCSVCQSDVVITIDEIVDFTVTKDNKSVLQLGFVDVVIPAAFYSEGVWYKVTTIGNETFKGNTVMETVVIPSTVTSITDSAFEGCTGIKEIPLPDGLITIGDSAFKNCSMVNKQLVIPDTVTTIGVSAFEGCAKMTTARGGKGLVNISEDAFKDSRINLFYFTGSKDEFLLIEISDAKLKSTQVWYYSEVKVSGCWHYNDAGSPMPW